MAHDQAAYGDMAEDEAVNFEAVDTEIALLAAICARIIFK
jgi:hypothetical protein